MIVKPATKQLFDVGIPRNPGNAIGCKLYHTALLQISPMGLLRAKQDNNHHKDTDCKCPQLTFDAPQGSLTFAYLALLTYLARKAAKGDDVESYETPQSGEAEVQALQPGE